MASNHSKVRRRAKRHKFGGHYGLGMQEMNEAVTKCLKKRGWVSGWKKKGMNKFYVSNDDDVW